MCVCDLDGTYLLCCHHMLLCFMDDNIITVKSIFSDEAVAAKRHRRRLERKWKSGGGERERLEYRAQCKKANSLITKSLQDHNRDKIEEAGNNPKTRWQRINKLLYPTKDNNSNSSIYDPSAFVNFFNQKVRDIQSLITAARASLPGDSLGSDPSYSGETWSSVESVSPTEASELIASMPMKSSPLDIYILHPL